MRAPLKKKILAKIKESEGAVSDAERRAYQDMQKAYEQAPVERPEKLREERLKREPGVVSDSDRSEFVKALKKRKGY